ncbi:helix-turn-helix domain-containing protein [Actinopolymorpha singaporensis]|uniref:Helix-turn-helix n=2 Tax=Actinopolymorpha TaxID=117156 RepID=A0A1H1LRT0_9ACTN|nr:MULTISPECIES: helix-turn-helix transcriptional regulator [Actinopolymorpha]NYH88190.1 transcriptional regulator with XRE-family HTH domain [Actinopolymorpha rutila]SDR77127.1 Helix-turn-helix [Actinopolymorpha singaporensis]
MKVRSIGPLGDYLREQRRNAELSLRQLADLAGVSNPYLSQIERGVRKPSAEVLQQLAKALRVSAEVLYVRAGLLDPTDGDGEQDISVEMAIHADPILSVRQKRVLLDIYSSFRREADEEETSEPERESTTQNRAVRHARQED